MLFCQPERNLDCIQHALDIGLLKEGLNLVHRVPSAGEYRQAVLLRQDFMKT